MEYKNYGYHWHTGLKDIFKRDGFDYLQTGNSITNMDYKLLQLSLKVDKVIIKKVGELISKKHQNEKKLRK